MGSKKAVVLSILILTILNMMLTGCKKHEKIFTIGIVSNGLADSSILKGFKNSMVDLGYIEGKNIKYIYNPILEFNDQNIDTEIKRV